MLTQARTSDVERDTEQDLCECRGSSESDMLELDGGPGSWNFRGGKGTSDTESERWLEPENTS